MKQIVGYRRSGKTTEAVKLSASTGCPILVATSFQARNIEKRAESLGLEIPKPIGLANLLDGDYHGTGGQAKDIIIDEGIEVLKAMLHREGVNVTAVTITHRC